MGDDQGVEMDARGARVSARELDVLRLVVEGLSNAEIGGRLCLSKRTVQGHLASAMRKTGTRSRTQLAVHCLRVGMVALHPVVRSADERERSV